MKNSAIENQFKEKMSSREIAPSKASWDRLDAMLAVAEKPKRSFKWMYVAASLLGFLLFGTFYFNQNNNGTVVNDTITVNKLEANIPKEKVEPAKTNLQQIVKTTKALKEQLVLTENNLKTDSNLVVPNAENRVEQKGIIQEEQTSIINQKAEQPIMQQKSNYVNVDELLASVDNSSKSSMVTKSNVKVNSNELLTQVDGELDLTFREKAIKVFNRNIKSAKLALSNRNSE